MRWASAIPPRLPPIGGEDGGRRMECPSFILSLQGGRSFPTNPMSFFAGVEGGGTHSNLVILDEKGTVITRIEGGPSTNYWLHGKERVVEAIVGLVEEGTRKAGIPSLRGLGLSLSGMNEEREQIVLREALVSRCPALRETVIMICNDAVGSIATGSDKGGVVLIAGTGSACRLETVSGQHKRCGGWGHMLGDEGGAYSIAISAIKTAIRIDDGWKKGTLGAECVLQRLFAFFGLKNRADLLALFYQNFVKANIAKFAVEVAKGADTGDALCLHVFHKAGKHLGEHVKAVLPLADAAMLNHPDGLTIICVGSVWKSFHLLRNSLLEVLQSTIPHRFRLVKLCESCAVGAASLASQAAGQPVPLDYDRFRCVIYDSAASS